MNDDGDIPHEQVIDLTDSGAGDSGDVDLYGRVALVVSADTSTARACVAALQQAGAIVVSTAPFPGCEHVPVRERVERGRFLLDDIAGAVQRVADVLAGPDVIVVVVDERLAKRRPPIETMATLAAESAALAQAAFPRMQRRNYGRLLFVAPPGHEPPLLVVREVVSACCSVTAASAPDAAVVVAAVVPGLDGDQRWLGDAPVEPAEDGDLAAAVCHLCAPAGEGFHGITVHVDRV